VLFLLGVDGSAACSVLPGVYCCAVSAWILWMYSEAVHHTVHVIQEPLQQCDQVRIMDVMCAASICGTRLSFETTRYVGYQNTTKQRAPGTAFRMVLLCHWSFLGFRLASASFLCGSYRSLATINSVTHKKRRTACYQRQSVIPDFQKQLTVCAAGGNAQNINPDPDAMQRTKRK
jgi:hypothetical protein